MDINNKLLLMISYTTSTLTNIIISHHYTINVARYIAKSVQLVAQSVKPSGFAAFRPTDLESEAILDAEARAHMVKHLRKSCI